MPTNRAIVSPEKQKYFAKAQDGFSELRCTKSPIHRLHSDKLAVKRVRKWLENTKQRGKRKKEKKKKKKKRDPQPVLNRRTLDPNAGPLPTTLRARLGKREGKLRNRPFLG